MIQDEMKTWREDNEREAEEEGGEKEEKEEDDQKKKYQGEKLNQYTQPSTLLVWQKVHKYDFMTFSVFHP